MEDQDSNGNTRREAEVEHGSLMSLPKVVMRGSDFLPQTIACLAATTIVLHAGAQLAFSAVLLPELMAPGSQFRISEDEASWIASIVTVSTPVGSLLSGPLMDKFGRKSVCKLSCVPLFLAWLIIAFSKNVYAIYCGRLLAGLGGGLSSAALVYISEISHPIWRSSLLCLISIFVTFGILLVCILCLWLDYKQMSIFFTLIAIGSYFSICFIPETPHWLLKYKCKQQAIGALHWLYRRDLCYDHNMKVLMKNNQPQHTVTSTSTSFSRYFSEYKKPSTLKPIVILMFIFIFQQISGAYVVIFYAVNILHLVGGKYGSSISEYTAFLMLGIIRFGMSIFTAFASKRCGRRPLLMVSGIGMAVSVLITAIYISSGSDSGDLFQNDMLKVGGVLEPAPNISHHFIDGNFTANEKLISGLMDLNKTKDEVSFNKSLNATFTSSHMTQSGDHWLPLVCFIIYVFFGSLGVSVIPWTLIGELSPINVRGSCGGLLMAFSYLFMFAVVKAFPYLLHIVEAQGIFFIFSATSFLGAVFVFLFLPETRGKTFEEIENYFK